MSSAFYDAFAKHLAEQLRKEHATRLARGTIGKKNPKKITVFMVPELDDEIAAIAASVSVSKSTVIRYLLREAIADLNVRKPDFTSPTRALLNRDPEKNITSFEPTIRQKPRFKPLGFGEEL